MTWYRVGTVSVTNGSATVTGSGTAWNVNASLGEGITLPDGRIYEIVGIASDTSLTITPAYLGSTASGQSYAIAPLRGRIAQLLADTSSLLSTFATVRDGIGAGLFPDGSVGTPALRFSADQDTGLFRPGNNRLAFVTNGVQRLEVDASGNALFAGALRAPLGAVGTPSYTFTGDTNTGMWSPAADTLALSTAGAERVRIDSSGNVGIGTTSPGSALQVQGLITGTAITQSPIDTTAQRLTKVGDFGLGASSVNVADFTSTEVNFGRFFRALSGATGGLGIGASFISLAYDGAPSTHFLGVDTSSIVRVGRKTSANGTPIWNFLYGDNNISDINATTQQIFRVNNSERMRIDSSGNVGIGTSAPSATLKIIGTTNPAVDLDYYETGTGGASYRGRKARGSAGSPAAVASGDYLSTLLASGYGATGFGGNIGLIGFRANQNFTDTARGTNIVFENTPDGTNSRSERMRITAAGGVAIGTTTDPGLGNTITAIGRSYFCFTDNYGMGTPDSAGLQIFAVNGDTLRFGHRTGGTTFTEDMRIAANGRVGIGTTTPDTAARLDVSSTTSGFLPPRMTTAQRDAITSPPNGLMLYNTTTDKLQVRAGGSWVDLH
jgi:hypothetical protein